MHKRLVNQCTLDVSLSPRGPVLIQAGKEGADPTKPNIEFVETYHSGGRSVYFPGSSLKGAIRAHAERIVRTIGSDKRPATVGALWASDPLNDKDKRNNPNQYLEVWKKAEKRKKDADKHPFPGAELYKQSCFITQLFGSTSVASRLRIQDAYPIDVSKVKTEERNGVAIDRVFGSVAVGPFNYQVCTAGDFRTQIHLKNFTLEQLGLIGLVLRDLDDGWFGIGFAKSRGMGMVNVSIKQAVVAYPGCELVGDHIQLLGATPQWSSKDLIGAGAFLEDGERERYGFAADDVCTTDVVGESMNYGLGVKLTWDESNMKNLFTQAVSAWKKRMTAEVTS